MVYQPLSNLIILFQGPAHGGTFIFTWLVIAVSDRQRPATSSYAISMATVQKRMAGKYLIFHS